MEMQYVNRILVGKPEGKRPLREHEHRMIILKWA
jgi:hypothetical protein